MRTTLRQVTMAGALLLASAQQVDDASAPPARRAVAGLRGIEVRSTLALAAGGQEQALETTFVFPDRARLSMVVRGGRPAQRRVHYRFGTRAWSLPPGSGRSVALEGADRDVLFRDLELRRAAFLWPDGFEWRDGEDGDGRRRAALGALGTLWAEVGPDDRPARLWTVDPAGAESAAFRIESWREAFDRTWPERWSIELDGRTIARETIGRIHTSVFLVEPYFLPPDRRTRDRELPPGVSHSDLHAAVERTVALSEDERRSWTSALDAWSARAAAEPPGRVVAQPIFELDERGRPTGLVLRLAERPASVPAGWRERTERPALTRIELKVGDVDRRTLGALRAQVPAGVRAGAPYLWLREASLEADAQLVLPLE